MASYFYLVYFLLPLLAVSTALFAWSAITTMRNIPPQPHPDRSSVPSICQVPLPRNPYFTGRTELLQQLYELLTKQPVALCGLGGIGKTQVAVEYAYQHQAEYSAIFWLNVSNEMVLHTGVSAMAKELGLNVQLPPPELRAVVKQELSKRQDWLLIIDNADELSLIKLVLTEVLPLQVTGQVLLTTRHQAPPPPLKRILIDTLTDEEGAELLLRRTAEISSDFNQHPDYANACQLSHTLQGLPLALAQATAYLYKRQYSYPKYLALYQHHAARLLQERGELLFDDDHPWPIATTWQVSLNRIEQQQPRSLELLNYCAFLAPNGIPEEVLQKVLGIEEFDLEELLDPILSYSLLTRDSKSQQVQVHGLVRTVLRANLTQAKQRELVEKVVMVVEDLFLDPKLIENWPACERLVPSALACAGEIERYQIRSENAVRLLNRTAYYLQYRNGNYDQALPLYQQALAITEQVLDPAHPLYATSLDNLAWLYQAQGEYDRALPLYQRALEIWEQVLGTEHPNTATALHNLAVVYRDQGDYAHALPLLERALAIRTQKLDPDHPRLAQSYHDLGLFYQRQGQDETALSYLDQALTLRERKLGPNHPDTAHTLGVLALVYQHQGQEEKATQSYDQAVSTLTQRLGAQHPETRRLVKEYQGLQKDRTREYGIEGQRLDGIHGLESG